MYNMLCWITEANEYSGTDGITFDEFIQYAAYFFSQRHEEEGLKYIFQLYDTEKKGYLTKQEFQIVMTKNGFDAN